MNSQKQFFKAIDEEIKNAQESTELVACEKLAAVFYLERARGRLMPRLHPVFTDTFENFKKIHHMGKSNA